MHFAFPIKSTEICRIVISSFENVSNFGKMSETIKKFSNESASKVKATASLVAWLDSINKNNINLSSAPLEAIDQLIELIKIGLHPADGHKIQMEEGRLFMHEHPAFAD